MSFYKVKAMKAEKWGKSRKGSPYITLYIGNNKNNNSGKYM